MHNIVTIDYSENRVETGVIRFGDDWPGYFFRGDDCMGLADALNYIISRETFRESSKGTKRILTELRDCFQEAVQE
jgi:hypothetical protein